MLKAKTILLEIKETFPGKWQSIIAEMMEGSLLCVQKEWKAAMPYMEKSVDKIGSLEKIKNEEYMQFKRVVQEGRDYDPRGDILEALIYIHCMNGDIEKAKVFSERLIKTCPGHPQIAFAKRALKKLEKGISPYNMPSQKTKQQIAEEIREVDEE